jgi:TolB-like protein
MGSACWRDKAAIRSLAVAPFVNLTGDSSQLFLTQGITDQLITGLAQIGNLKVIRLRDQTADLMLAHERGIDIEVVLGGSLQRAGQEVRITARSTPRPPVDHLGSSYTGQLPDILNLQDSVVRAVADTLRVSLSSRDSTRLSTARRQLDPAAYEAYVRGVYFLEKVTGADFRKAIGYFQQAIDAEPFYAAAYNGISICYSELGYYALGSPEETFPRAQAAALKALEIDSTSAAAYASLARVQFLYSWDFAAAERSLRRAVALDSSSQVHATTPAWGVMNRRTPSLNRALQVELDPFSAQPGAAAALLRPVATKRSRRPGGRSRLTPPSAGHYWLGMAYEQTRRLPEAIGSSRKPSGARARSRSMRRRWGTAHAAGQEAQARRISRELQLALDGSTSLSTLQ